MGSGHADLDRLLSDDGRGGGWLVWAIAVVAALTTIGLISLWPRGGTDLAVPDTLGFTSGVVTAEVVSAGDGPCSYASDLYCHLVVFELRDGGEAGGHTSQEFEIAMSAPRFDVGDRVVLNVVEDAPPEFRYQFADRDRRAVLWILGAVFAAAVVGLGRLKGLAALGGLAASIVVLVAFIAPGILMGHNPVLTAAVGGSAIALLSLYMAHGWHPLTHVAAIGTFASLALTLALSALVASVAEFSGFGSEESFLLAYVEGLQVRGLILAGAVLGAIGALDDVTVTQASTVFELHRLSPDASAGQLFSSGLKVGRDHIASTVNTLLLAYAGAAMPLLLLFTMSGLPLLFVANSEIVAVEIFRTLVGSIGLVAAVPLTTWLAARVATRLRPVDSPDTA